MPVSPEPGPEPDARVIFRLPFWTVEPEPISDRDQPGLDQLTSMVAAGTGDNLSYGLQLPKWQFLTEMCGRLDVVLHGSALADITEFAPRKSDDVDEFGNQQAVYAASDGVWAIFFAVVDRRRVSSLLNACFRVVGEPSEQNPARYFFSVDADALPDRPWREGTVYLLPRRTFVPQPPGSIAGLQVQSAQWASTVPVLPLARLSVVPADFPFLAQVRSHEPGLIQERARLRPDAFPWLGDHP